MRNDDGENGNEPRRPAPGSDEQTMNASKYTGVLSMPTPELLINIFALTICPTSDDMARHTFKDKNKQ